MHRRAFIAMAGAATLLPSSGTRAADPRWTRSRAFIEEANACEERQDFVGMVANLAKAFDAWPPDADCGRRLAWACEQVAARADTLAERHRWNTEAIRAAARNVAINGESGHNLFQLAWEACFARDAVVSRDALDRAARLPTDRFEAGAAHRLRSLEEIWLRMFAVRRLAVQWTVDPRRQGFDYPGRSVYVLLPQRRAGEQFASHKVRGATTHRRVEEDERDLEFVVYEPTVPMTFDFDIMLSPVSLALAPLLTQASWEVPPACRRYLGADPIHTMLDPEEPMAVALARVLTADTPAETLWRIIHYRQNRVDWDTERFPKTTSDLFRTPGGACTEAAVWVCCVARAAGIPMRLFGGQVLDCAEPWRPGASMTAGSHVWAEAWLHPHGWVELDPGDIETFGHKYCGARNWIRMASNDTRAQPWFPLCGVFPDHIEARVVELRIPTRPGTVEDGLPESLTELRRPA